MEDPDYPREVLSTHFGLETEDTEYFRELIKIATLVQDTYPSLIDVLTYKHLVACIEDNFDWKEALSELFRLDAKDYDFPKISEIVTLIQHKYPSMLNVFTYEKLLTFMLTYNTALLIF